MNTAAQVRPVLPLSMALGGSNPLSSGSSQYSSPEEHHMRCSSLDDNADICGTFNESSAHGSCEETQEQADGSETLLANLSSYFCSHGETKTSSPVADDKNCGLDLSLVKQEQLDTCVEQDTLSENVKEEEPSSQICLEDSMSDTVVDRDQAVIDFRLHKSGNVNARIASLEFQSANTRTDPPNALKEHDSLDNSIIKLELCNVTDKDEDEALHDIMNNKYQDTLKQYKVFKTKGKRVYHCKLCSFSTALSSIIKTHMYTHTENTKPFRCHICDSAFRKMAQLKKHKLTHYEQKPFQCSFCIKGYSSSLTLKHHILAMHARDIPFSCNLGAAMYVQKADLETHKEVAHMRDRPFTCMFCNYHSKDQKTLKLHLTKHSDARPYMCDLCPKAYKRLADLKVHIEKIHEAKPIHRCHEEGCSFATSKILELRRHALIHTDLKLFPCPQCQQNFTSQTLLWQHLRRHSGDKVHNCTLCDYGCLKLYSLKRHVRIHLVNSGNQCPICQEDSFPNEAELIQHVLNHSQNLPYHCNLCPQAFLTPRALHDHKVVHKEERPYICSVCESAFKKEQDLKRHILSHTQERPFKCVECGKGFLLQNQLNLHMVVHSDDRPYSCSLCSYTCKRASDLRVHTLCHSQERTISCNLCSYTCKRTRDLNRHMRSHTTDKPYECPVCGVCLRRAYNLRQHMLRHGEQERGEVTCRLCHKAIPNTVGLQAHMTEVHPGVDLLHEEGINGYGDFKSGSDCRLNNGLKESLKKDRRKRKKIPRKLVIEEKDSDVVLVKTEMINDNHKLSDSLKKA
ncbi:Zinc finger protein 99-like [Plakobranchus ocellatus]|uniref:Zinc finger protein 99-like n=1 Tax=Plakobranchus ocellatus TaxID=259542 RepID=A0AAV3Z9G7_9GAST|nr:Zinc finger protein 99-like [Plakobranchus ocellatus]